MWYASWWVQLPENSKAENERARNAGCQKQRRWSFCSSAVCVCAFPCVFGSRLPRVRVRRGVGWGDRRLLLYLLSVTKREEREKRKGRATTTKICGWEVIHLKKSYFSFFFWWWWGWTTESWKTPSCGRLLQWRITSLTDKYQRNATQQQETQCEARSAREGDTHVKEIQRAAKLPSKRFVGKKAQMKRSSSVALSVLSLLGDLFHW